MTYLSLPRGPLAGAIAALLLSGAMASAESFLRDSDGDVISNIRPVMTYYRDSDGEVIAMIRGGGFGGASEDGVIYMRAETTSGNPTVLRFDTGQSGATAASFQVESSGGRIWLRDTDTGQRFAGQRVSARPDARGRRVNPQTFQLD